MRPFFRRPAVESRNWFELWQKLGNLSKNSSPTTLKQLRIFIVKFCSETLIRVTCKRLLVFNFILFSCYRRRFYGSKNYSSPWVPMDSKSINWFAGIPAPFWSKCGASWFSSMRLQWIWTLIRIWMQIWQQILTIIWQWIFVYFYCNEYKRNCYNCLLCQLF